MEEFKSISKAIENELDNFGISIDIDVKFSNFNENIDVQINNLIQLKKEAVYPQIINTLSKKLETLDSIESFEILETGFINIKLSEQFLINCLKNHNKFVNSKGLNNSGTVFLDYGGANIGKSLHVGHMRTLNIGRSLRNIYQFAGYKTITDIHFGDWGMPIALIIAYIEKNNIDIDTISSLDLEDIYPNASRASKDDESFYKTALNISKEMNLNDSQRIKQWGKIYKISTENIKSLLSSLGFEFDYYLGESDVISLLPEFIEKLKKEKLVKIDDGALISNDDQDPPALITKSDGSYMYLTTDLGTIIYREKNFKANKYIYIVDQRQKNHFNQLFKLIRYFNLSESEFFHVSFGTVNDKHGKPLKTRDGDNYKLEDLYKELIEKIKITNKDPLIVKTLAKSVLTYSDLVTKRTGNYLFDIDKFTNVSGKSAIFIQYAQVRASKLLNETKAKPKISKINLKERELIMEILKFNHYFNLTINTNEPHHLAEYAYNLCHEFNKFYTNNKIFSESIDNDLKNHRLYIVEAFYITILKVFECLGIEPVAEM